MSQRTKRNFTEEFKAQAVELLRTSGKSAGQVAKDLDPTPSVLRNWARRAAALLVGQHVDDQRLELLVGRLLALFRLGEVRALVVPAVPPAQDPLRVNPERRGLLSVST